MEVPMKKIKNGFCVILKNTIFDLFEITILKIRERGQRLTGNFIKLIFLLQKKNYILAISVRAYLLMKKYNITEAEIEDL
ncbi:hypothetical protein [Chryseobacterium sp. IT-36CA2]|uniref:hypothetical protein n=1 Tax=Chryseobacterium sp. IT-36CA2 TaxID=3026460 RepID=UPI0039E157BC